MLTNWGDGGSVSPGVSGIIISVSGTGKDPRLVKWMLSFCDDHNLNDRFSARRLVHVASFKSVLSRGN